MRIFFEALELRKKSYGLRKEKTLTGAFNKTLCFMMKSLEKKQKSEEIFFLFAEDERLKIISEDGKSKAYFNKNINISDFCNKCEEVYFNLNKKCKCKFDMHYVVKIEDTGEESEILLASPEAMILEDINKYYGIRIKVKNKRG